MTTFPPALTVTNLTVQFGTTVALESVDGTIPQGALVAIAGPNGAGKSTLIHACIGLVKPVCGTIHLLGDTFEHNRLKVAYIPQKNQIDWNFPASVREVVLMGRYGHVGWFGSLSTDDYHKADHALAQVGLEGHAHHTIGNLSGGQQQRVLLARALAQEAELYILDEPFIGLDHPTQDHLFHFLKQITQSNKTVIIVHHDILTLPFFDWLWLINKRSIACGPTNQTFTTASIGATYGKLPSSISFG